MLGKAGAAACFVLPENRGASLWEMLGEAASAELEHVRLRVAFGDAPDAAGPVLGGVAARAATASRRTELERRRPRCGPTDTSQIQFTSGTTGFPKGAELNHGGIVNNARLFVHRAGISRARPPLQPDALLPLRRLRDVDARHRSPPARRRCRRSPSTRADGRGRSRRSAAPRPRCVPTMMIALEEEVRPRRPRLAAVAGARGHRRLAGAAGSGAPLDRALRGRASTTPTG